MQEITHKTLLVSANGGALDYVTHDGEILFSVDVPRGSHKAGDYLELAPDGVSVQIADGLVAIAPKSWAAIQQTPDHTDTGANPDFQPTDADRLQRQMRHNLAVMQAEQKSLNARIERLAAIERVPTAPAAPAEPEADVVE